MNSAKLAGLRCANSGQQRVLTDVTPCSPCTALYLHGTQRVVSEIIEYKSWICLICGWIYNEEEGLPEEGLAAGTRFPRYPKTGAARCAMSARPNSPRSNSEAAGAPSVCYTLPPGWIGSLATLGQLCRLGHPICSITCFPITCFLASPGLAGRTFWPTLCSSMDRTGSS